MTASTVLASASPGSWHRSGDRPISIYVGLIDPKHSKWLTSSAMETFSLRRDFFVDVNSFWNLYIICSDSKHRLSRSCSFCWGDTVGTVGSDLATGPEMIKHKIWDRSYKPLDSMKARLYLHTLVFHCSPSTVGRLCTSMRRLYSTAICRKWQYTLMKVLLSSEEVGHNFRRMCILLSRIMCNVLFWLT